MGGEGSGGHNKVLSKTKKLRGDPGKRGVEKEIEPPPAIGSDLECPKHLQGVAREEWYRIIADLKARGLYTRFDLAALSGYCACFAMHVRASEIMGADSCAKSKRGDAKMSSQFLAHMKILEKMNMYLRQFGFSPQSRIAAAEGEEKDDEFTAWKKGAKK